VQTQPGIIYQFGPFQVNVASGELLKNGRHIKLQEQPCRLLVALVESPGEVISREELQSRLWPGDTFVDFDGSLRVAVRKLREALNDDAEDPRYIETIPRRGYRFLGPEVRRMEAVQGAAALEGGQQRDDVLRGDPEPLKTGAKTTRWWTVAAVATLIVGIGLAVVGWMFFPHKIHALTDKDTIVLADFANATGDPVFDGTLRQGLSVQLEESPFLSIIPDEKIQQTLGLMGQRVDAKLVPAIAREVCQRTASAAVLYGSIASVPLDTQGGQLRKRKNAGEHRGPGE
jgi:eukaryotic-like serine/threonine-protein kinase